MHRSAEALLAEALAAEVLAVEDAVRRRHERGARRQDELARLEEGRDVLHEAEYLALALDLDEGVEARAVQEDGRHAAVDVVEGVLGEVEVAEDAREEGALGEVLLDEGVDAGDEADEVLLDPED